MIYKELLGLTLIFLGLYHLSQWYILDYPIPENSIKIIIYMAIFFSGIYLISPERVKKPKRRVFYTNLLAVVGFYCFFSIICFWWKDILLFRFIDPPPFVLSAIFASIPMNNLSQFTNTAPTFVIKCLRIFYSTGYFLPLFFPVFTNFFTGKYKRCRQYLLSGHCLQVLLLIPFYMLFQVQEIWYVTGIPDGMLRVFSNERERAFSVSWCFPSMHTSVAIASLLVALREEHKLFKWMWCIYCIMIIASTVLLPIHWTIDVIAGAMVGYVAVRWANIIISSRIVKSVVAAYCEQKPLNAVFYGRTFNNQ